MFILIHENAPLTNIITVILNYHYDAYKAAGPFFVCVLLRTKCKISVSTTVSRHSQHWIFLAALSAVLKTQSLFVASEHSNLLLLEPLWKPRKTCYFINFRFPPFICVATVAIPVLLTSQGIKKNLKFREWAKLPWL